MTDHSFNDELDDDVSPELRAFLADDGDPAQLVRSRLLETVGVPAGLHEAHVRSALGEFDRLHAHSTTRRSPAQPRASRRSVWARFAPALVGVAGVAAIGVFSFGSMRNGDNDQPEAGAFESRTTKVLAAAPDAVDDVMSTSAPAEDAARMTSSNTDAAAPNASEPAVADHVIEPTVSSDAGTTVVAETYAIPEAADPFVVTEGGVNATSAGSGGPQFTDTEQLVAFSRTLDLNARAALPRLVTAPTCGTPRADVTVPIVWNGLAATLYVTNEPDGARTLTVIGSDCATLVSTVADP